MIDEIYENYEKRLSNSNPILKSRGINEDINDLPIGINSDIENILAPFELLDYDDKELGQKIKEAYITIFKEGIYLGVGLGKIIEMNYAKSKPERFVECLEENSKIYTSYDFKIEVMEKIIPPIKVQKFTQDENPKKLNYRNKKFEDIRGFRCINIETEWEDKLNIEINKNVMEMEEHIQRKEMEAYLENEEVREYVEELKRDIQTLLFEKFFEALDVDVKKAVHSSKNKLRFDEETALDVFISPTFTNLEGEFELIELITRYLINVFNEGKIIGLLNGVKIVIDDIKSGRLDYDEMNSMGPEESYKYIKENLGS